MTSTSGGRKLALLLGALAVLVLCVATWRAWPHLRFWWGFEPLGMNAQGLREYRHRQTGMVFVRLPGGTFSMGSPAEEPYRGGSEGPVHEVTLSPFLIGKYEVTQCQWKRIMGSNPSHFEGEDLPLETVSWDDCEEFCRRTGLKLPSEAQWEYAARGYTRTAFSFGSGEGCADWECAACPERDTRMWYCGNSGNGTHEVGSKAANPFGLHDVHGNVGEWCEDVYSEGFYSTAEAAGPDPVCTSGSGDRVIRGGYWYDGARSCRSADRFWRDPRYRDGGLGFRPAGRHAER